MGPAGARVAAGGALLGLSLVLAACTTTHESDPVGLALSAPVRTEPLRAWRVVEDATTLGYVVLFGEAEDATSVEHEFFSVRNPWQQELGSIDGLGRAWRFVPHSTDPEWISTGTVLDGATRILGAGAGAVLDEIPLESLGRAPAPGTD